MKVLLLTDAYPPIIGVASIRVSEFVKTFSRQKDTQVRVVVYNPVLYKNKPWHRFERVSDNVEESWYGRKILPGVFHTLMDINPLTLLNWFVITIVEIKKYNPDVVVTSVPTMSPSISAGYWTRLDDIPVCIDLRDSWINPKLGDLFSPEVLLKGRSNKASNNVYIRISLKLFGSVLKILFKAFHRLFIRSCNNASLISAVYTSTFRDVENFTTFRKNVLSVPNGVNIDELNSIKKTFDKGATLKKYGIERSGDEKYVIFAGAMGSYYRPEALLKGLGDAVRNGEKVSYLLVGEGALILDRLNSEIAKQGLSNNVFYLGKKAHGEVLELLLCADVAFYALDESYPSPDSALGVKVLEYTACKLPILSIAPPNSSVTSFITGNNIGIALTWPESEKVGDSLIKLLNEGQYKNNIDRYYDQFELEYGRELINLKLYREMVNVASKRHRGISQ